MMRFDRFMESALYDPVTGFYERGGRPGRGDADFLTSPEVGPLFGAVIARALDSWWRDQGCPAPFTVVEAGAGPGTLARSVAAAVPGLDCAEALRYVLVERSATLRRLHPQGSESLEDLPSDRFTGVVLANELLDNMALRLLERTEDGWAEVYVEGESEVLRPADDETAAEASRLAPDAALGARVPLQHQAGDWLRRALAKVDGRVVVVDYADGTPSMAGRPWTDWLRTYRSHGRGGSPFQGAGSQDITCEVAVDQLAVVRAPNSDRSQADFLRAHGLGGLADAAATEWQARAHIGDLQAMVARSRVNEAAALSDPGGLGAFRVLEWNA